MALPVYKEMASQYGWIYRKDIADKYGIDMGFILSDILLGMKKVTEHSVQVIEAVQSVQSE